MDKGNIAGLIVFLGMIGGVAFTMFRNSTWGLSFFGCMLILSLIVLSSSHNIGKEQSK